MTAPPAPRPRRHWQERYWSGVGGTTTGAAGSRHRGGGWRSDETVAAGLAFLRGRSGGTAILAQWTAWWRWPGRRRRRRRTDQRGHRPQRRSTRGPEASVRPPCRRHGHGAAQVAVAVAAAPASPGSPRSRHRGGLSWGTRFTCGLTMRRVHRRTAAAVRELRQRLRRGGLELRACCQPTRSRQCDEADAATTRWDRLAYSRLRNPGAVACVNRRRDLQPLQLFLGR